MRLSIHMIVAAVTVCMALAAGTRSIPRTKQPRATRGFKNTEMMTARGFGKRGLALQTQEAINPFVAGPTDNFLEMLDIPQDRFGEQLDEKLPESVPVEWFVNELVNNPDLARIIVRKFMDTNQDGMLSPDELLRNVY